jgi:hypothetical protein
MTLRPGSPINTVPQKSSLHLKRCKEQGSPSTGSSKPLYISQNFEFLIGFASIYRSKAEAVNALTGR